MSQPFHLCADLDELHVNERLNYVLGQVLGVKDFQQEQLYFLHKARLHNRSLHGYGTVWGLDVTTQGTSEDLEIQVDCGLAIDPLGREVLVDALQCAQLNTWLSAAVAEGEETANRDTLMPVNGEGSPLGVYVTLCYYPCQTGAQPILGNPCRTDSGENGVIQYTRIRDEFELQLRSQPPRQHEEDWVRAIGDLLAKIELVPGGAVDVPAAVQILRDSLDDPTRLATLESVGLPEAEARDILRELLRYWVTNTRPSLNLLHNPVLALLEKIAIDTTAPSDETLLAEQIDLFTTALDDYIEQNSQDPIDAVAEVTLSPEDGTALRRAVLQHWASQPQACKTTEDDCLLLAIAQFDLTAEGTVDESTLTVEHLQRPYLLHTRLLQELLLQTLLQGSTEIALGEGTAEYEAGDSAPGVYPAEPLPDGANVAFNVVVPNPLLGEGSARYQEGDDAVGVFPVSPLPNGTNVAFNVVMPPPPPTATPPLANGSVTFESTTRPRGVYPAGTAEAIAFDVVIPQSSSLPPPARTVLRPIDMVLFGEVTDRPEQISPDLRPARPGTVNGYPALIFPQNGGLAAFSILRPNTVEPGQVPFLRLYCTAAGGGVLWQVLWRWRQSLRFGEAPRASSQLTMERFREPPPENEPLPFMRLQEFHLQRSPALELTLNEEIREEGIDSPDYLAVYLSPRWDPGNTEDRQLYLLIAELTWGGDRDE